MEDYFETSISITSWTEGRAGSLSAKKSHNLNPKVLIQLELSIMQLVGYLNFSLMFFIGNIKKIRLNRKMRRNASAGATRGRHRNITTVAIAPSGFELHSLLITISELLNRPIIR